MYGAWYPDPYGRFDLRWHDGQQWTHYVARGGWVGTDTPPPLALGAVPSLPVRPTTPGANGLAIAGFVLALVGALVGLAPLLFFEALVGGVLGIIFSLVGLGRAKHTTQHRGRRLAVAGIVLSVAALGLGVLGVVETLNDFEKWMYNVDDVALEDVVFPSGPVAESTAYEITPGLCTNPDATKRSARFDGVLRNDASIPRAYRIIVELVDANGVVADRASSRTPLLDPGQSANWIAASSRKITGEITCRISEVRYERR